MKVNKQIINKYLKKNFEKLSKFLKKRTDSYFNKISKLERYKIIIEKLSQYNIDEIKYKKSRKKGLSKKVKSFSLINNFVKSKNLPKIKKLTFLNPYNFKQKNLKIKNKISNFYSYMVLKKQDYLKTFDKVKTYKLLNIKTLKEDKFTKNKFDQKIGIVFYGDHKLILLSATINLNNKLKINGVTEIPIPGNVIGDSIVEDTSELANIILDSLNLLELNTSPLLIVLSNSFFNIHTFKASDLKQISPSDNKVQSKSPYLPLNTLVDFLRMSDTKISDSLIRTVYSNKDLIKGWTNTLEIINLPVIGLVPSAPSIFDSITERLIEETTILIDIESASTTLLIGSKLANLTSYKLPFGSSLYISNDLNETSTNYFDRVLNSINTIMKDEEKKLPSDIFVMGSSLDKLINKNMKLPNGFKKLSALNLTDFSYVPKSMKIHELVSESVDSSIYSLSTILSSCL